MTRRRRPRPEEPNVTRRRAMRLLASPYAPTRRQTRSHVPREEPAMSDDLVLVEALVHVTWRGQDIPAGGRLWLPRDVARHWQRRHAVRPLPTERNTP